MRIYRVGRGLGLIAGAARGCKCDPWLRLLGPTLPSLIPMPPLKDRVRDLPHFGGALPGGMQAPVFECHRGT